MKRTKFKFTIFALALVFVFSVASLLGINLIGHKAASAAGPYTVGSSSGFYTNGEAAFYVYKPNKEDGSAPTSSDTGYTLFSFGYDDDNVSYKKNLAYNWWEYEKVESEEGDNSEGSEEGETPLPKNPVNGHFNMEIGFVNTSFKRFIITFESQQYEKTEDGKSVNYILFFPAGEGKVKVLVTDDKDGEAPADEETVAVNCEHIYINFGSKKAGEYPVFITDGDQGNNNWVYGTLKNVGGNYAKYSSSSTTPVYPLIFGAEFDEEREEGAETAQMVLYRLNNQDFTTKNAPAQVGDNANVWTGGSVTDNTPAVLCVNTEVSHLNIGGSVSFDYQLIDVLRPTATATLHYYVLKYEDVQNGEINFNDYKDERFVEVKSDFVLDSDREDYLPTLGSVEDGKDGGTGFGAKFKVDMAVKVYAEIVDTSGTNSETSYVFLDWYVPENLKLSIAGYDFIAVGDNLDGVTFNYTDKDGNWIWDEVKAEYQKKVNEAAKNLSAGSSSYFYVPSAETLFVDDATAYSNMKISIYYYSSSQSSNTSLATNNLSINVTKYGSYRFTLYATDAAGNDMYYIDNDGELVEFKSSDIWNIYEDEDRYGYLPWFSFNVDYKGAQFKETPGKQNTAYVGTNYSSASFNVNGVENSYEVKYRLFIFDKAGYSAYMQAQGVTVNLSYDWFLEVMDELFNGSDTRQFFEEILQVSEGDEFYDDYKDYKWSNSGTSFTPQVGNALYYMRAEVTDTEYNTDPVTCSLAIQASVEVRKLKGDSEWLKNNIASVILLSIAGVSVIAIILLIVIKPKDKGDIDVEFEKMKKKKKK